MPVYKSRIDLDIARNVKAFLSLDAGFFREKIPSFEEELGRAQSQVRKRNRQLERARKRLSQKDRQLSRVQRALSLTDQRKAALQVESAASVSENRSAEDSFGSLIKDKKELIDFACKKLKVRSFADLGGVWNVNGGYTFYALEKYKVENAFLVDMNLTDAVTEGSKKYPRLEVIRGDFSDQGIAKRIESVDAVIFFDVLLHQVAPDWHEILDMYSERAQVFLIYNQQFLASESTIRLLDLGEEEYFKNVPGRRDKDPYKTVFEKKDEINPQTQRPYLDARSIWQWGIVDDDLIAKMRNLGFTMQYFKNCGQFHHLNNFENHAFVFTKDKKLET